MNAAAPIWFYTGIPDSKAATLPSIKKEDDNNSEPAAAAKCAFRLFMWCCVPHEQTTLNQSATDID